MISYLALLFAASSKNTACPPVASLWPSCAWKLHTRTIVFTGASQCTPLKIPTEQTLLSSHSLRGDLQVGGKVLFLKPYARCHVAKKKKAARLSESTAV